MKKNILIYLSLAVILSFFACEKDETRVVLKSNPTAPTIIAPSTLVLLRDNATDTLSFEGIAADFGFKARITYSLQAAVEGTNFENAVTVKSNYSNLFQVSTTELNEKLLLIIDKDVASVIEMRVVASVEGNVDAAYSEAVIVTATPYGPPTLFITGDIDLQGIVSAKNDGIYVGWIYTDGTPFTFTNGDNGTVYGATGGDVVHDGSPITLAEGVYNMRVNINTLKMTYTLEAWGILGSAIPPYDWSVDVDMTYNLIKQRWEVTGDFIAGKYKFRANNSWDTNYGDTGANGTLEAGGDDIVLATGGNYTIVFNYNLTYTVVKN